jgi:3'-5' exoribonuclease
VKKHTFVKDITREYMDISDLFIVTKKGTFTTKNNTKYMSVSLRDKTGVIEGKVWERVDELQDLFDKNDLVYVKSKSRLYQEKPQLNISDIRKVDGILTLDELKAFLPEGDRGSDLVHKEFWDLIQGIQSPPIQSLFEAFRNQSGLTDKFFSYPASIGVHHMYLGGLLEHSVAVARMAKEAAQCVGGDQDIVVAGSLLHDIGKVEEMEIKGAFQYSDKGRLLGHISLGVVIFEDLTKKASSFPQQISDILKHIIISHHGVEEWGSPRKPMCVEALIVHYIDNLDAKIMGVREHMKESMEDELWTTYHRLYESRFYRIPEGIHGD